MKARKKPVVIDYWDVADLLALVTAHGLTDERVPEEVRKAERDGVLFFKEDRIVVHTLEGIITATRNEYLLRGVRGEFYPHAKDFFAEVYEEVAEAGGRWHPIAPIVGNVPGPYDIIDGPRAPQ